MDIQVLILTPKQASKIKGGINKANRCDPMELADGNYMISEHHYEDFKDYFSKNKFTKAGLEIKPFDSVELKNYDE